jgi:hypothetical protein
LNDALLIITADDLGLCPPVDAAIADLAGAEIVTAAALFVNCPLGYPPKLPDTAALSVGLHLNLSLGLPLSRVRDVSSLVDADGRFFTDIRRFLAGFSMEQAVCEMDAQLRAFESLTGRAPAFLNFHKHLADHDERLFDRLLDAAVRLHCCPVRVRTESARRRCQSRGIPTTDHFVGDVCAGGYWTPMRIAKALRELTPGVTELMCHPAYPMAAGGGVNYAAERDVERRALMADTTAALLTDIRRGGFERLACKTTFDPKRKDFGNECGSS